MSTLPAEHRGWEDAVEPPKTKNEIESEIRDLALGLNWIRRTRGHNSRDISKPFSSEKNLTCFICDEEVPSYQTLQLACGHRHCYNCLRQNFEIVIAHPAQYPPKCCDSLDIEQGTLVLSPE
ncbi:hypothetical protein DRE_02776 [Drechslerella stenobrocha 248]|uniref:RING-type domain-containing protein n=1 Tax=Drechslerella stenobrocha 248 TaxID=1043628 RepID=W7HWH1_9PEZI|nr:hypothetical protein DRE_02776 [Drechslerella stenobrocha 248]